ncbi:ATP-binding protein [Azoarcus sp. KH32C]|uniref:ATP-binding protein n=1 Tax=Azoarcus sp. KH32C TaxID=748247 RepID=UPI0002386DB1|nr:ATP-binding protein [Azoarcus sp. KH32C]BAL24933.1 putative two-component hybrid sensor and regulator [Azoarcus sp. KH32C]
MAIFALLAWATGLQDFFSISVGSTPIQAGSVLALGILSFSLHALAQPVDSRRRWLVVLASSALVMLAFGGLALNVGMVRETHSAFPLLAALFEPSPILVGAPSCYLLLGISMILATLEGRPAREWSQFLAVAVAGIVLVALVGLTVRLVRVDVELPSLSIPLPIAVALLAASFSILATRPAARLVKLLEHDSPGALVVRRLVPMAIGLPLVVVLVQTLGLRAGWFESTESEGVLTVSAIVAAVALILWMSGRLDEMHLSRSRAEQRAETERQWLEVTLAYIGDAVVTVNDEARISFMNPAAEALTGVSAASAVGESVSKLVALVDGPTGRPLGCPLDSAFMLSHSVSVKGEPAVRRRDGTLQAVEVTATPFKDERQRVTGGVMVLRDVSANRAREHAEREAYAALDRRVAERTRALDRTMSVLRESTTLLITIAASTPELIVAKSRDGQIMMINPAALQAMGLNRAQVVGRKEEEIFGDTEETRRAAENDRRVIETGRPVVVEERRTVRSETRTYLVTKSPLRNAQDEVFGLVGVAKDITERKRAQHDLEQLLVAEHHLRGEAERANRAKDEFLAIVSHELRSPLNALKGWSQVLIGARTPDPSLVARAAEAIKRNIDHQTRLIDDLLDTSRIISGKLELHLHRVNLVEVVNAALELSRDPAKAKNLELGFACECEEVCVDGDFDRLQQVLSNLLSNAIKFTPEGGEVQVRLRMTSKCAELSVSDTGIGIEADFLPHVFDRFSQADTSMTRRYLGLGIGLALVRNLVELHDGTVQATSAGEGKGSIFTVILPRAREQGGAGVMKREVCKPSRRTLTGVTALLVDDDPDAREVMRLILGRAGARVLDFESGEALFAQWELAGPLSTPTVLLLDIAMPGDSGFEVLGRIRSMGGSDIPAIAVTALTHLDNGQFSGAGFKGKVGKPVDEESLVNAITAVLNGSGGEIEALPIHDGEYREA